MIDTVLFDMGGTLEDIFVDEESRVEASRQVMEIAKKHGYNIDMELSAADRLVREGWDAYGVQRDSDNRELKPEEIWGNFIMPRFGLNFAEVKPFA